MNKQTIITILLALVAMAGQAKTYKTIKAPEWMACVNVRGDGLKACEVVFRIRQPPCISRWSIPRDSISVSSRRAT